jgi:hypothetical protein
VLDLACYACVDSGTPIEITANKEQGADGSPLHCCRHLMMFFFVVPCCEQALRCIWWPRPARYVEFILIFEMQFTSKLDDLPGLSALRLIAGQREARQRHRSRARSRCFARGGLAIRFGASFVVFGFGHSLALTSRSSSSLAGACVDKYMQDQLIMYMALAKGKSKVLSRLLIVLEAALSADHFLLR